MIKLEAALSTSASRFSQPVCVRDGRRRASGPNFSGFVTLSALRQNFCRAMAAGFRVTGVAYALL